MIPFAVPMLFSGRETPKFLLPAAGSGRRLIIENVKKQFNVQINIYACVTLFTVQHAQLTVILAS